uniref:Mei2-like C-terminal RNA recognition motif domain-containing protein n=1 Tax=Zooxanthella nutricula TaxID=1333877 RepID=A0A7S2Q685_9DINO|mmetsp:Transcript_78454/g.240032  ORF Transcript_78454/g.240032 Transcript_78454/m.240032 type:complete len:428 (+) Transcript_78454:366-1649(+)
MATGTGMWVTKNSFLEYIPDDMAVRKVRSFTDVDLVGGAALAATEKEWPFVEPHLAEPQLWPVTLTADSVVEPPALDAAATGVDAIEAVSLKAAPALGGVRLPVSIRACDPDQTPTQSQRAYVHAATDATSCHGRGDICGASTGASWPSSPATTACDSARSGQPEAYSPPTEPLCWPATPTLDAVLEPPALDPAGSCSTDADGKLTVDLRTALGLDRSGSALGGMHLPQAPCDTNGVPMRGQWAYMHFTAAPAGCLGRQQACYPPFVARDAHSADGPEEAAWTSVMLRNLPRSLTRDVLVQALDCAGFAGRYDFLYVPIDFKTGANLGYALINLIAPSVAALLWAVLEGFADWGVPGAGACEVSWSRPLQGLEAYVEKYRNSPVMHADVADQWKPAIFRCGVRAAFPMPTKALKTPKTRGNGCGHGR